MKRILASAVIAFSMMGAAASAATFTIVGGSFDSVPGGSTGNQPNTPENNVLDALMIGTFDNVQNRYELNGYMDGISIAMNGSAKVKVELLGWEAGFYNSFSLDGNTVGKGLNGVGSNSFKAGDPLDSFTTGVINSLDFVFNSGSAPGGLSNKGSVANGDANTVPGKNFFASCGPNNESDRSCNVMYILYDDDDVVNDNHDDLVIRISAIPLPAGALLLMTGLGALALRRRKTA